MKTVGQIIKDARVSKNFSLKKLEDLTKIRATFIESIEKGKWDVLPPFPTVLGFVKSVSSSLEIDEKMAIAVLKRDYPPKKLNINPKPDVSTHFTWSPKLTFAVGIGVIILAILGYLGFQYHKFISPPNLIVESPKENQIVTGNSVLVFGTTDLDSKITVNNQSVLIDENGKFSTSIGTNDTTHEIDVIATSRSGKMNEVRRSIVVSNN